MMIDRISPFQLAVMQVPEVMNLALLGARGGGKTTAAVLLAARHLEQHAEKAAVMICRKTYKSLTDFEDELLQFMGQITGGTHSYNRAEKVLRWNGGTITLAAMETLKDYTDKYQGKNVTLLIVDEVTAYSGERILRLLRSNVRAPEGVPTRIVYLGNPGGPLHGRVHKHHIKDRTSHVPYEIELEDGHTEPWVTILSGPGDNPFIDQAAYVRRLREACHGDPVKLQQWLFGSWEVGEGLLFPAFDASVHVNPLPLGLDSDRFAPLLACDWGISSPSVALLAGRARRDLTTERGPMPKNSVILLDEVTDCIFDNEENLNTSREWPPDRLAERVDNMCADHGVRRPSLTVDSARGLVGDTVQNMMQSTGHFWNVNTPRKGRRAEGWADVNSRLAAAAERDPVRPHLYVSPRCELLLRTLPHATRDDRDPDDWMDVASCPDHAGDALRYLLADARVQPVRSGRTTGLV